MMNRRKVRAQGFGKARRRRPGTARMVKRLAVAFFLLSDLAFFLVLLVPLGVGGKWVMVLSGSMTPVLQVGGLVLVIPATLAQLDVGDIVVHRPPTQPKVIVAHRAVERVGGESPGFLTKGDANEEADQYVVTAKDVVGKVVWHIPSFGYAVDKLKSFSRSVLGLVLLTGIPGTLVVLGEIRNIVSLRDPRKTRQRMLKARMKRRGARFGSARV